ncbi:glycine cleavage system protein H [Lactiplantibacillus herbarum]|uniref:glycine cleavage system protein H n=1 Tax=Lactiplantibacillus herbarum TaxID=1670446 RepID=UPI00064FF54F|nr:glycine cleavage system protein H [Lactiplantibacillus herbarum]
MAQHESAWKQMINYYRTDYQEKHAPMLYGNVWITTKSHQRFVLGLTDSATATFTNINQVELPAAGDHLAAGETLVTITADGSQHVITTPFSGTVKKCNTALDTDPAVLKATKQAKNWLIQLKAD